MAPLGLMEEKQGMKELKEYALGQGFKVYADNQGQILFQVGDYSPVQVIIEKRREKFFFDYKVKADLTKNELILLTDLTSARNAVEKNQKIAELEDIILREKKIAELIPEDRFMNGVEFTRERVKRINSGLERDVHVINTYEAAMKKRDPFYALPPNVGNYRDHQY